MKNNLFSYVIGKGVGEPGLITHHNFLQENTFCGVTFFFGCVELGNGSQVNMYCIDPKSVSYNLEVNVPLWMDFKGVQSMKQLIVPNQNPSIFHGLFPP